MKVIQEMIVGAVGFGGLIGFMALIGAAAEWLVRL